MSALAIGLGLAVLIFLLFAIGISLEIVRPIALLGVMMAAPALMLFLGGNAFGLRRRQGRTYASAFELTQPSGTAQLAGLKLLVRTACLLAALTVVAGSAWASSSLIGAWGSWAPEGGKDVVPELLLTRQKIGDALAGMMGYSYGAQALITSVAVAVMVAAFATFAAVRARYPRRVLIVGSLLLIHALALILLAVVEQEDLMRTAFAVTGWTLVAAMVFATVYCFWRCFVERALTVRYASAVLLVSAAFGAAWLAVLQAAGVELSGMPAAGIVGILWPVLLPPLASVLAPWSLSRLRHT